MDRSAAAASGVRWLTAPTRAARGLWSRPAFPGYRPTPRRFLNLWLNRWEHARLHTRLRSRPQKLIIEPINACNLRCPGCFTGAGERGRAAGAMPLALYRRLLDEIGDTLFEVEAFNWGEPLLAPSIDEMIEEATRRGIGTKVNTNFSLPFDAERAERLVRGGLTTLTVSIDGAQQASYQQYRVRGELRRVLHNCRLVADAKRRLGRQTPQLNWEFHVFPHNLGDLDAVRALADELGMSLLIFKGAVPGADWDVRGEWRYCVDPQPMPCGSLWAIAVVNSDGGVAPCNGTFYREDDVGQLALAPGGRGAARFADLWNGPRYRSARRFYRARQGSDEERQQICFDCPQTKLYERFVLHSGSDIPASRFALECTTNDAWNYFWQRRPARASTPD